MAAYLEFRGFELAGKTMGIVGMGAIGRRVARLARALGMRVLGYDPYAIAPRYVTMTTLEQLLSGSDIVTLHAPETPETTGMLGPGAALDDAPGQLPHQHSFGGAG